MILMDARTTYTVHTQSTRSMCWGWCLAARSRTRPLYPHAACAGACVWLHGAAQERCIHTQHVLGLVFGCTGPHKNAASRKELQARSKLGSHPTAGWLCFLLWPFEKSDTVARQHLAQLPGQVTVATVSTYSMCWGWCLAARGRTRTLHPHAACAEAGVFTIKSALLIPVL